MNGTPVGDLEQSSALVRLEGMLIAASIPRPCAIPRRHPGPGPSCFPGDPNLKVEP
jgi:hypothetical protein